MPLRAVLLLLVATYVLSLGAPARAAEPVRIGILGLDNYQAVAYTQAFNNPKAEGDLAGLRVVAALLTPSADYPEMLELVAAGKLRPQALVEQVVGLAEGARLLPEFGAASPVGVTLIDPRQP